jgi:hypothetical protein
VVADPVDCHQQRQGEPVSRRLMVGERTGAPSLVVAALHHGGSQQFGVAKPMGQPVRG